VQFFGDREEYLDLPGVLHPDHSLTSTDIVPLGTAEGATELSMVAGSPAGTSRAGRL
jgi:hypothetical protein